MPTPSHQPARGFTLIELLIVIAITMILLASEVVTARLSLRSTRLARENDRASAILSDQLALLRSQGLPSELKAFSFEPPQEAGPPGLGAATGEISFSQHASPNLVIVMAELHWKSMVGHRDLTLTTLMRKTPEGKK